MMIVAPVFQSMNAGSGDQAEIAKQCDDKEGCKHEANEGGHKCGKKDGQQEDKHECGGEGCGHDDKD